jgi:hypothetical protein
MDLPVGPLSLLKTELFQLEAVSGFASQWS